MSTLVKFLSSASPLQIAPFLLIPAGILVVFAGNHSINRHAQENFSNNMHILYETPQDWSCFYSAKQYQEECDELNRDRGMEYIDGICKRLEYKLTRCKSNLYKEIRALRPYSMDPPLELDDVPYWVSQNKRAQHH